MKVNTPYKNFSNYILRTPMFSFDYYKMITSQKVVSDDDFKKIWENPVFKEAIFLASPALYKEIEKWVKGNDSLKKKEKNLKFTMLKYFSRMCSRCTPFGLFSGCSVGRFANETSINLKGFIENKRHTRLDMDFLVDFSQDLSNNEDIRKQLLFHPNSSIYKVGDKFRYVEYTYKSNKRHHQIVAVDASDYLNRILKSAKDGALLVDLISSLVDVEISIDEATSFIEELTSNQILVNELEPSVSGPEFLYQIISVLEKLKNVDSILYTLEKINEKINSLDKKLGNNTEEYVKIENYLKSLGTDFDKKYLFQTDTIIISTNNTLDINLIEDIKKGFLLLNKITPPTKENLLENFKIAFVERFEEREIPLSNALDPDTGIGYKRAHGFDDVNPLIDDIQIIHPQNQYSEKDIKWNSISSLFQKKLIQAFKNSEYTIQLTDEDFSDFEAEWNDLPDTLSSMIEIINDNGKEKIRYSGAFGSSAANLLSRFCHGDDEIHNYTKEIVEIEEKMNQKKILGEILHLPEARVGNILTRPSLRRYEIPYLSSSLKPKKYQLPLDDLMISVKNNRIVLRSKSKNQEVKTYLTNAHNYKYSSLEIYHFLADMQMEGLRMGVGLNLSPFSEEYEFTPRIEYRNLILQNAIWNLQRKNIESLLKHRDNDNLLYNQIMIFKNSLKLPQFVMLKDGDNELLINFENLTSIRMFLNTVRKRTNFQLIEFLFGESGVVRHDTNYFTNQFIVSFYNEEKLNISKKDN